MQPYARAILIPSGDAERAALRAFAERQGGAAPVEFESFYNLLSAVSERRIRVVILANLAQVQTYANMRDLWHALEACQGSLLAMAEQVDTSQPDQARTFAAVLGFMENQFRAHMRRSISTARLVGSDLGRPKLSPQLKGRILHASEVHGPKARAISRAIGVPPSTVQKYLRVLGLVQPTKK